MAAAPVGPLGSAVVRWLCFVGLAMLGSATVPPVCGAMNSDMAPVAAALFKFRACVRFSLASAKMVVLRGAAGRSTSRLRSS